jgi:glycosyltransferase involved in cell wall biosynthesis
VSAARAPHVLVSGIVLGQPMGGVRRHNMELLPRIAKLLRARGGSLTLLEGRTRVAFALPEEIERVACDVPAEPPLARWRRESHALRAAIAQRERERRPIDFVHTAHLPAPLDLPLPYTLTLHDLRSLDPRLSSPARRWVAGIALRRAIRGAEVVITVSRAMREEVKSRFHTHPECLRVVPNAANHFAPLPREPREGAPLLCVGHLERRKNLDLVLRALALDRGLPPLDLAGAAKAREEERLRRVAHELGISGRVRFVGAPDDAELPALLSRAACVVLPSRVEGFGIGALEAQRARVPLAIASLPALVEVTGGAAPSFDPEDPSACALAIRHAMGASRDDLDRAAAQAARYRWEDSARAWLDVWCSLAR